MLFSLSFLKRKSKPQWYVWYKWFAWYPVRLQLYENGKFVHNDTYAWLQYVDRRCVALPDSKKKIYEHQRRI